MVYKHSSVTEAYTVLGLDQGASLEVVKSTYKQLALKTHPDKNPGDANATTQFQKLSEAYNVLVKHLDHSSAPSREYTHTHSHPFGHSQEDYDDDDDDYLDDDYDDEFERMAFYTFIFEELLRGRASRYAHAQYRHDHPYHHHHVHHHDDTPPESEEQYTARLRLAREEQEQAAERRTREEAHRKATQERERVLARCEAEERQRAKASTKKAEAETSRKTAEQKVRTQQQQQQTLRSQTFAAARRQDAAAVKKGIWEDNVDAAGGEIRTSGAEGFVKELPTDPKETLLHIAAKNDDLDLVEWLDSHSAEPDERNGVDMTPFHVALQGKCPKIVNYFFDAYSPQHADHEAMYRSPESKSNLLLALDTKEPEMVWLVLDKHLYTKAEMDEAWTIVAGKAFKSKISTPSKYDEFANLFKTFGGYSLAQKATPESNTPTIIDSTPSSPSQRQTNGHLQNGKYQQARHPPPMVTTMEDGCSDTTSPLSAGSEKSRNPLMSPYTNTTRSSRGQHVRNGSYPSHQHSSPSSPVVEQGSPQQEGAPKQSRFQNRGRGRSRGRGQFRGRGRGGGVGLSA